MARKTPEELQKEQKERDSEFARLFETIGPDALAQHLEIYLRSVYKRRAAVEERLGRALTSPGRPRVAVEAPPRNALFERKDPPPAQRSIEELVEYRRKQFQQKDAHEEGRRLIPIKIKVDGPIGILFAGDPHVDDDGTDIDALERDANLARETDGLFAICVGDVTNNWVGRLERLYAEQSTTAAEAWLLAEWWLKLFGESLLWLVGGNHDCHDRETEGLTERGWVPGLEVREDDRVLSMLPDGTCEWTGINEVVRGEYVGEMLRIENRHVDAKVTPNHHVILQAGLWGKRWGEWSYSTADDLPAMFRVPVSASSRGAGVSLSDAQIKIAGWLLTDGSIQWAGNSPRVSFWQSKSLAPITSLLDAERIPYRVTTRHREIAAVCGRALVKPPLPQHEVRLNTEASRRVLEWVPEKGRLPAWVRNCTDEQFDTLLDALIQGDGVWDGSSPEAKLCAVLHGTREFLEDVQAHAVAHGWRAFISVAREKDYRLNLTKSATSCMYRSERTRREWYSGPIWCLRVPHGNFMIRRNGKAHFSGNSWSRAGDPLRWIMRGDIKAAAYQHDDMRAVISLPCKTSFRVHNRHTFPGHSMYNPAHGVGRELQFGKRDHIAVSGHTHTSGYVIHKDPGDDQIIMHGVQVAAYKRHDLYSRQKHFKDNRLGPSAMAVINPGLSDRHPDFIKVFWCPLAGADYLGFLRGRYQQRKSTVAKIPAKKTATK